MPAQRPREPGNPRSQIAAATPAGLERATSAPHPSRSGAASGAPRFGRRPHDCTHTRCGARACAHRCYRSRTSPELDRAGGEPALSVEVGRDRRARLDEPPEARGRDEGRAADQDRRGDRARARARSQHGVLRHAPLRRAHQAHVHERVLEYARLERGDRGHRARPGRHAVRRLCAPDPSRQLVQLPEGRREHWTAAASRSTASTASASSSRAA